ncbi:EamA-like transporter family protein [Shimia gijangensis]|uniref:EamA-like transporter family protein n=1 Tax=Shimia gijangensis TaxID=1470563 RepID=A0A1M6N3I4_9RHOB|nr:DMT family transporter [Shimia gijangensis]SHJ90216.1 EamA-like transporter family protein [Shimia gijangensis]
MALWNKGALAGTGLVLLYTLAISSADAITKFIAAGYAAPQLFAFSGAIVVGLSWVSARASGETQSLRTSCPRAMALRALLTVIGSVAFFYAFRFLPFAEVFVFIGMMPIFAGLFSAPILGEYVRPVAWAALAAGFIGVLCLFPGGIASVSFGHLVALFACLCGTLSMVLARFIGRYEANSLAQVFFPNAALCVAMAMVLPFVYKPMPLGDLGWVGAYAVFLFAARWLLVVSLRLLAAYAVTPLMNLQFVWMVVLGAVFFGEVPASNIYLGVAIVIGSGVFLIWDQMQPTKDKAVAIPLSQRFSLRLWQPRRYTKIVR